MNKENFEEGWEKAKEFEEEVKGAKKPVNQNTCKSGSTNSANHPCPQLPGTVFRIFIPAGFVINVLNIAELTSPSGICLILRIPALGGNLELTNLFAQIQRAGGSVEVAQV